MEIMNLPEFCSKCNIVLHNDTQFFRDCLGFKIRLYCQNGHSFIFSVVKFRDPEDNQIEKELKELDDQAAIVHQVHSRNRSVLCDICKKRIFNAGPNQKRHPDECRKKFLQAYFKKYKKQKLQKVG